jgi:predicted metal-dependent peptidase
MIRVTVEVGDEPMSHETDTRKHLLNIERGLDALDRSFHKSLDALGKKINALADDIAAAQASVDKVLDFLTKKAVDLEIVLGGEKEGDDKTAAMPPSDVPP